MQEHLESLSYKYVILIKQNYLIFINIGNQYKYWYFDQAGSQG